MTKGEYQYIPDTLQVRGFRIKKRTYITTLLDSLRYKKNVLRKLYQQRWHIELDLRAIRRTMGMEPLHCKTQEMVRKEIAVTLIAYNMVRALIAKSAIAYHVWPRQISFKGAMTRLTNFKTISQIVVGQRNGRQEPWALKKRRTKHYPYLYKTRKTIIAEMK